MKSYTLLIVFIVVVISCEKEPVDIVYSDLGDRKEIGRASCRVRV